MTYFRKGRIYYFNSASRNSRVSKIFEHILKTWRAEGCASSAQAWRKHFRSCAEGAKGWRKLRASYAQAPWKNYWKGTAGGRVA